MTDKAAVEVEVEAVEVAPLPKEEKSRRAVKQERARAALAKEPLVPYRAPARRVVTYNGLIFQVEPGQTVKWPQPIVDLLEVRDRADLFIDQGRLKGSGAFIHEGALRNSVDGPGVVTE